jgi:pimeloyl-ACP methyl ester carboxylesterase
MIHQPTTPSETRRVPANGIELSVTTWRGDGPPLLLVHGVSSGGVVWTPVIDALATFTSPITFDLRGHGGSDKPAHGYLYEDYVKDLDGLLAQLGLDRPLIMGHSLGGIITLWWATTRPDSATALVIEDSPLRSGKEFAPAFERWLALNAMSVPEAEATYAAESPGLPPEVAHQRAVLMNMTARAVFTELYADSMDNEGQSRIPDISVITSPTLLVHGDPANGSMVNPADAASFPAKLRHAEVIRIPGAGHNIHITHPREFLTAVIPFLRAQVAALAAD